MEWIEVKVAGGPGGPANGFKIFAGRISPAGEVQENFLARVGDYAVAMKVARAIALARGIEVSLPS